jgi:dTDP-4-dehydrorhamnose 3,5-epimerase
MSSAQSAENLLDSFDSVATAVKHQEAVGLPQVAVGKRDQQLIDEQGNELMDVIDGVRLFCPPIHVDARGDVIEAFHPNWKISSDPLLYVYRVSILPGVIKGWIEHHTYSDRSFFSWGNFKIVLYDNRPESKSFGRINELFVGSKKPTHVVIPPRVFHAIQNIGSKESWFINMPTKLYDFKNPDKYRLPINDPSIPYRFK